MKNNKKIEEVRFSAMAGWTSLSKEKLRSTRKAMKIYRKEHPNCEMTGSNKKIQIHHIVPIWANPDLADHPDNFIALSSSAHIHHIFGHDRNFAKKYVSNIREISEKIHSIKGEMDVVAREEVSAQFSLRLRDRIRLYFHTLWALYL